MSESESISPNMTFFGLRVDAYRRLNPGISCPTKIARGVLDGLGVSLGENQFKDFATDLAQQQKNQHDKGDAL